MFEKDRTAMNAKTLGFVAKSSCIRSGFGMIRFECATKSDGGASVPNGRVCQNPFERVPLPRPNWTQLAWKHCTCILRNHKMVCPSHPRTYCTPSPGTCSAWTWPGTLWARCPVRRFFNWRTSTSLISPSTRSRSLRRTLLLVSSFRIEKLTQHNDISHP